MSKYKHLPIYKSTYELLEIITRKTKNFSRDFKYSLGDKIRNECIKFDGCLTKLFRLGEK